MTPHPRQTTKAELLGALKAAGAVVQGNKIKCPFHDDRSPSAGVFQGDDGIWRYRCHSCGTKGDVYDIEARMTGRPLAEILRENAQDATESKNAVRPYPSRPQRPFVDLGAIYGLLEAQHGGRLEALHEYTTVDGQHVQYVIRWRNADGKKTIRPAVKTSAGLELRSPENRFLYRLPETDKAKTVVVVEGEAKADILAKYGFTATTSAGGSKAAAKTDWQPLAGKNIILWPDYDTAGMAYADDVRRILDGLDCKIKIIDPATLDLPETGDVVDYVQQVKNAGLDDFGVKEALLDVFKNKAHTTGPSAELDVYYEAIFDKRFCTVKTGFSILDGLIQVMPESLTVVCGSPGASKSLMMLQWLAFLLEQGTKAACLMLERKRPFHLARALAQRAGIAHLTHIDWAQSNPDLVRQVKEEHREFIDRIGRSIWVSPDKQMTQADIINWAKQRADTGHRLMIIDPATLAGRMDEPYKADEKFVQGLKAVADTTKTAIVVVLHPIKGQCIMPDLSSVSGGAVYQRAADCVLWLDNHDPQVSNVFIAHGYSATEEVEHNRTLIILKSRDGSGTNSRIAFDFSAEDLTLKEMGLIVKKKKKKRTDD